MNESRQKYLVLTCDTEAVMAAAPDNHVERLIWGRVPEAPRDAGIGLMMDIADEFGVEITFFLDIIERTRHGAPIDRVAQVIQERGHDLQLHLHIEFLPEDFWRRIGRLAPTWAMNQFNDEAARCVIQYAHRAFQEVTGALPCAYRAGAFRYNQSILKALGECGVMLSFDYYPVTALKPAYHHGPDAGVLPVFRWSNGVIEVPVGCIENPNPLDTLDRYVGFESIMTLQNYLDYMNRFWAQGPEHNVLVLVLHSWNFLRLNKSGHYVWRNGMLAEYFRDFLGNLPPDVRVVSARELLQLIEAETITPAFEMPLAVAGTKTIPLYELPPPDSAQEESAPTFQDTPAAPPATIGSSLKGLLRRVAGRNSK